MRWVRIIAITGVLWCVFEADAAIAGVAPLSDAAPIVAVALIIPALAVAMFTPYRRRDGQRVRRPSGVMRKMAPELTIGATALLSFVITVILSPIDSSGVAEIVDGRYVLNSHGVLTPIDKATYESRMLIDRRITFSVLGVFGVLAALECTARIRLAADDGDDSDDSRPAPSRLLRP